MKVVAWGAETYFPLNGNQGVLDVAHLIDPDPSKIGQTYCGFIAEDPLSVLKLDEASSTIVLLYTANTDRAMDSIQKIGPFQCIPVTQFLPKPVGLSPLEITPENARMFFGRIDNTQLISAFSKYLNNDDIVFDIGGNCGFFTKWLIDKNPEFHGICVLFEPIQNLVNISTKILEGYRNVHIMYVNTALGDHDGELLLYLPNDSNIGWITAVREQAVNMIPYFAKLSSVKRYIETLHPNLIKIDVEGFEYNILKEILPFLGPDYRPVFVVELGWGVTNPMWPKFLEFAVAMLSLDYRFKRITGEIMSFEDLARLSKTTDVLFVPRERDGD